MKEEPSALDRVLRALNHPVRRRILRQLANQPGSASTLSRAFEMDLGVVSYHLNKVLAEQCGVIELVDTVQRRGSVEKFYELRGGAPLGLAAAANAESCDEVSWTISLGQGLLTAVEAKEGKRQPS